MTQNKKYKAREFAAMLGVAPENLRDWRRRGISIGSAESRLSGEIGTGHVEYDDSDLLEGKIMLTLYREAFDLSEAWQLALHIAPIFNDKQKKRFALCVLKKRPIFTSDASDVTQLKSMVSNVIDIHALERSVRDYNHGAKARD